MTILELVNWFAFSIFILFILSVAVSYMKSSDIIKPKKTRVVTTPENLRLVYEEIDFQTTDGIMLKGWFVPSGGENSSKTIIICHGWGSNKSEMLRNTFFLAEKYNLFYFDFRASGESKGNVSTIGFREILDFNAALNFLRDNRPLYCRSIAILGLSMGASVALYAAANVPGIKCVVAENAFYSYKRVVANWSWWRLRLPYWPLIPMTLFFVKLKLKENPEVYSSAYHVSKVKIPALFINGDADDIVPLKDGKKLYSLCPCGKKEIWVVKGAPHAKCAEVAGENYERKLRNFFGENF